MPNRNLSTPSRRPRPRIRQLTLLVLALMSLGASYRTDNFIVTASSKEVARDVAIAAENYRQSLAYEWLGHELGNWREPCPIHVRVASGLPPAGRTSFVFLQGQPTDWQMSVQGSKQLILESVLPHEVAHTVFATHFGQALPRWADEGASTIVEASSEQSKQQEILERVLATGRAIAMQHLFAMHDYPKDIVPLYSQGHSLAQFLISQGGKRKFIRFLQSGLDQNDWSAAIRGHYGYQDLNELQNRWLDWVALNI